MRALHKAVGSNRRIPSELALGQKIRPQLTMGFAGTAEL